MHAQVYVVIGYSYEKFSTQKLVILKFHNTKIFRSTVEQTSINTTLLTLIYLYNLTVSWEGILFFSSGLLELLGPESAWDFKLATVLSSVPIL